MNNQFKQNLQAEIAELQLKAQNKHGGVRVLVSAGSLANKRILLPFVRRLSKFKAAVFATAGTRQFFAEHGVASELVCKVSQKTKPNIRDLLRAHRFDLVINILTGDPNYDESSDSQLIRRLSVERDIPVYTDVKVAGLALAKLCSSLEKPISSKFAPWDLKSIFHADVIARGGYACHHAHLDKAFLISPANLSLGQKDMQKKWELYRSLKERYSTPDLIERISRGLQLMIDQGATFCRTMVDADSIVKLKAIEAAIEVKKRFSGQIEFEVGTQALEGVINSDVRKFFEMACEIGDFVGGLPSRDRPLAEKHLDIILGIAKRQGKTVDVHVDQENNPYERETEMLALKTMEHGMEGRVRAVHSVSLAAQSPSEQQRVIKLLKDAGVGVIVCPSAAISMKQLEMNGPLHNSIAPIPRLLDEGVQVYLGVDNIADLFMPIVDGDMWIECRFLMEATRLYDIEAVAAIAAKRY